MMLWWLWACTGSDPVVDSGKPADTAVVDAPPAAEPKVLESVKWNLPTHELKSPAAIAEGGTVKDGRETLEKVVRTYGLDAGNPWAVKHALIALGPDAKLPDGRSAVDALFQDYAEEVELQGQTLIAFPKLKEVPGSESIRIEPHTDLLLKGLAEAGVKPDHAVSVQGHPHVVGDLYRESLFHVWVSKDQVWTTSWNDVPWTLYGLAAWAPDDLAWVAEGGHPMTMDALTSATVAQLHSETQFLRDAMAKGEKVEKQKQGIFAYTCGGAHLLQGAAFAVARGFGTPEDRASIEAEVPSLFYRFDLELAQVDEALTKHPEYRVVLLVQRMKFLGHFLETGHELAALGFYTATPEQAEILERAAGELLISVVLLRELGAFEELPQLKNTEKHQQYLDLVGDAAHALHGLNLAFGRDSVRY